MNNTIFVIMLLMAMTGCASKYIPPESGITSTVKYKSFGGNSSVQVFVFDSYECNTPTWVTGFIGKDSTQEYSVEVESGKRFINTFRSAGFGSGLSPMSTNYTTIEFIPEANQDYVVNLWEVQLFKPRKVYFTAEVMKVTPSGLVKDYTIKEPERVCIW